MKKIVLAAAAAAVVLGAGTAALAASGGSPVSPAASGSAASSSSAPSAATSHPGSAAPGRTKAPGHSQAAGPSTAPDQTKAPGRTRAPGLHKERGGGKGHRPELRALGHALHAQWVTRDGANTFVTHSAIRGVVTAVSAGSITVKAEDGVSQTYAVTGDTKVRLRKGNGPQGNGRGGAPGTISDVHPGDKVAVLGAGTTPLTAQHIVAVTG